MVPFTQKILTGLKYWITIYCSYSLGFLTVFFWGGGLFCFFVHQISKVHIWNSNNFAANLYLSSYSKMDLHSLFMVSETLLHSVTLIQRQVKILRNWPQFIHFYHIFRWKGSLVILRKQGKGILWSRCHNVLGYGLKQNLILMLMLFSLSFTASLIKRISSVHTIRSQVPLSHNFTFLD